MQGLTFKAEPGGASDSLAAVVGRVLPHVLDCRWEADLDDWTSPPGAADLGSLPRGSRLTTDEILRLFASPVQVIDGELRAYALDGELIAVFRAVDSASWDVLSGRASILSAIRDRFPRATPFEDFPKDDAERVQLSEDLAPFPYENVFASLVGAGLVVMGLGVLSSPRDAPLGVVLITLPLLATLLWWRWGTRLFQVATTPTGFVVSNRRGEWFVPFAMVASTRRGHERDSRVIVVDLRKPVAGLRRFAFVAARARAASALEAIARLSSTSDRS